MADSSIYSNARLPYEHPAHILFRCSGCDKGYSTVHHLNHHQRSGCTPSKRNLTELLEETKLFWTSKKRKRLTSADVDDAGAADSSQLASASYHLSPQAPPRTPSPDLCNRRSSAHEHRDADQVSHTSQELDMPVANRKTKRTAGPPARYTQPDDVLPQLAPIQPIPRFAITPSELSGSNVPDPVGRQCPETVKVITRHSPRNVFGVARAYLLPEVHATPLHDPDQLITLEDLTDLVPQQPAPRPRTAPAVQFGPFKSKSAFSLAEWHWQTPAKSHSDFLKLISILNDPNFSLTDVGRVNWRHAFKVLGSNREDLSEMDAAWIQDDGWESTQISIDIPFHNHTKDPGAKRFDAGKFYHRSILAVIKEKLQNVKDHRRFHYYPFQSSWKRNEHSPEVELYGEVYSSQAFREAHDDVQKGPSTKENQGLERVVVALMLWSDATHLTSFGSASLWPCYLFFGNESKYRRGETSSRLGHHIAYFIKLPDRLNDFMKDKNGGKLPPQALFTYCKKELFHKQWSVLLTRELVDAMRDGIVLTCPDGQRRCFYPRILTYSADYPEKALIAGMRHNGGAPCHRCLIKKANIFHLGAPTDTERSNERRNASKENADVLEAEKIIERGFAVTNDKVEELLKWQSLVPRQTAFAKELGGVQFHLASALVVDVLHEFEIGVWKTLLIHLIRILEALSKGHGKQTLSAELDARYREVPSFGRDTIRKFPLNASQMRRKAARDYEDLLQCAIPTFEGLLPEELNTTLLKLLFLCAQWHALAKLRLHNDFTLDFMEYTTTQLGAQMRRFCWDSSQIPTHELAKEADARARRALKKGGGGASAARRPTKLEMYTIKFHFLGDYVPTIRKFGTSDSFSTQTGELYHRDPKTWFLRTDKKEYERQLSQIERRQNRLTQIRNELDGEIGPNDAGAHDTGVVPPDHPSSHDRRYTMGESENAPLSLNAFIAGEGPRRDPYLVGFIPGLKKHLLPRILQKMGLSAQDVTRDAWQHIVLQGNRLFSHKILRVNFTTYDVRRDEDIIHVDTPRSSVMLLNSRFSRDTWDIEHAYLYARILGVFHANVSLVGPAFLEGWGPPSPSSHRVEFAWIQWYKYVPASRPFALDRLVLCAEDAEDSLDFLDPSAIVRGVHLIPHFSLGKAKAPAPGLRFVAPSGWSLWEAYYINRFADRDMFMRFQYGMSVGHTYMHTPSFPPAAVPSIPLDFDHCLESLSNEQVGSEPRGERSTPTGVSSSNIQGGTGIPRDLPNIAHDENVDHNEVDRLRTTCDETETYEDTYDESGDDSEDGDPVEDPGFADAESM